MLGLLPPFIQVRSRRTDDDPGSLHESERSFVEGAVLARQREFAAVRECARRALSALGMPPSPIPRGPRGEPGWPAGVVGSMSHCEGMYVAALASNQLVHTLGIDAERRAPLPEGVLELVSSPGERSMLLGLAREHPEVAWDRLLFSAKEAVYKAWYPVTQTWLGFHDATISFDPESDSFTVQVIGPADQVRAMTRARPLTGRYLLSDEHVMTALWVPATDGPAVEDRAVDYTVVDDTVVQARRGVLCPEACRPPR